MKPFDPFSATFEDAEAQPGAYEPRGAMDKFIAAQGLQDNRALYEANPLDGIAACCVADLAAPEWLARAYLRRFDLVSRARVGSWDEAFGAPYPKGVQLPAIRRRFTRGLSIGNLVAEFTQRHPDLPIETLWNLFGSTREIHSGVDDDLVDRARRIGASKSTAQELYKDAVAAGRAIDHNAIRARLSKVPAKSTKVAGRSRRP